MLFMFQQKRKTLRASLAMQRQYNVGINSVPKTISSVVDRNRYPRLGPIPRTGPERAWPGGNEFQKNRKNEDGLKVSGPPKYLPAYTTDVSHLVV